MKLTTLQKDVLKSLCNKWVLPMDIGGSDGSYHSRVLKQLVKKGLVESKVRGDSLMSMFGSQKAGRRYHLANKSIQPTDKAGG